MGATLAELVYTGCFLTSAICAALLIRQYRRHANPLLLWSAACFVLLAISNLIVVIDVLMLPDANLRVERLAITLIAVGVLLFGFIWESEKG